MTAHPLFQKKRIFAPGPTPVPETILAALSQSPLHHRTLEFETLLDRVRTHLKYLFQTKESVYLFASSGTGAMEATIVNLFSKGDNVLVVNGGKFGERWAKIAQTYGLEVDEITVDWRQTASPDQVSSRLTKNTKAVLLQASETSSGCESPIEQIASAIKKNSEALVVVDGITAVGVMPLPMDDWGIDVVVSGSQKALMLPPGLSFLALSKRAQQMRSHSDLPKFYFDLDAEDQVAGKNQTAWTPAVSLISALDIVLTQIKSVGLDAVHAHHARIAEATRRGVSAMGLELFAQQSPSNALTSVMVPSGVDCNKLISHLRDRYAITIAGGQDDWSGKIFRIAHLGFYDELDVLTILSAVEMTLKELGHRVELGKSVGAASAFLLEK